MITTYLTHEYTFVDATTVNADVRMGDQMVYNMASSIYTLPWFDDCQLGMSSLKDPKCIPTYIQKIKPFELKHWSKLESDRSTYLEITIYEPWFF